MTTQPTRTRKTTKPKRKVNKLNLWTLILAFLVICEFIVCLVGFVILHGYLKEKPDLYVDDFFSPESSNIYDKDGNLIADVGTQLRENITYNQLSESIIDSFLAVEDSRFYSHDGFDLPRFAKSALVNVKNVLTRNPSRQGGSTFTMQLVKLTYYQNDETGETRNKDMEYKIQQISLARELEKKSNKKAIFELYLNKMNFGGVGNIRGIEKASQYYYGKPAGELNLAESAMLAGVINSPYYYDPHNFLDLATQRRNTVLDMLLRHGYINRKEYTLAKNIRVEDTLIDPSGRSSSGNGGNKFANQSYIDTVIEEAERITGLDPLSVAMEIYTYMDPKAQQVMDAIQSDEVESVVFPDDLIEIAMISENNQTGEIVAIGGGRNYGRGGSMLLNHATQQYKQPGSSVKPIIDYALAFEYLGWATSHVVTDKPIMYQGTNIIIKNANERYGGQMPLQYAVTWSLNTPAIQALQDVINTAGWQTVVDYIKSLGFSQVTEDNFDIGFAIGGSNFICTAEELMAAHAILMNGGKYIEPHTISKIVFKNGTKEPITPTYEPVQVLSPESAYLAASLMYNLVPQYTYSQLLQRDYPVYAKTGTTDWGTEGLEYNIPQGASKEVWMVSETSQYTTAVWVGYEKGIKDEDTYFDDYKLNLNIQGRISNEILSVLNDDLHPGFIPQPEGVVYISHILGTFPYAHPVEGMDPNLIATGLIRADKANLVSLDETKVEDLTSFTIDDKLNASFAPYPDPSKLTVAEDTMDISLYNGDTAVVSAWGKRIFDESWIYGPIRYKVRVRVNGEVRGEAVSESDNFHVDVDVPGGSNIEACGYYGFENGPVQSNEICVTLKTASDRKDSDRKEKDSTPTPTPKPTIQVPNSTADRASVEAWYSGRFGGACIPDIRDNFKDGDGNPIVDATHTNIIFDGESGQVLNGTMINEGTDCRCYVFD